MKTLRIAVAATALVLAAATAGAQDRPAKLTILAHRVHQTVATGAQGGDITADWQKRTGVQVEWVTMETGPLMERMFRELSLPETSIDVAFLLNTPAPRCSPASPRCSRASSTRATARGCWPSRRSS
jgi:multiple sugar transport system substrate-binding protein